MAEEINDILSEHGEWGFSEVVSFVKTNPNYLDDSPKHYILLNKNKKPSALAAVSPLKFPSNMRDVAKKTRKIRKKLGYPENDVILEPLVSDYMGERSYVIWPWCRELQDNKFHKIVTRLVIKKQVLKWLVEVARRTAKRVSEKNLEKKYIRTLQYVIDNDEINSTLREWAREGLAKIEEGSWTPCTLLQHTDMWEGNIMFPDRLSITAFKKNSFRIIDWAGALKKGYPYGDLIYYCCQYEVERKYYDRYRARYGKVLREIDGCEEHMVYYLAAYLGYIGLHRGEFQEGRYYAMVDKLVGFVVG